MMRFQSSVATARPLTTTSSLCKASVSSSLLTVLPFYLVPYDSITYLLGADPSQISQTLPLTAVFAPFYLLLRIPNNLKVNFSRIVNIVPILIFLIFCFITLVNIFIENNSNVEADTLNRSFAASRQFMSMLLGIATYYMFVDATTRISTEKISNSLLNAALASTLLVVSQFAMGDFRAQGFSSEPSHLADFVVWAVIPACLGCSASKNIKLVIAGVAILALLFTFSATGYLKALCVALFLVIVRGLIVPGLLALAVTLLFVFLIISTQPDNYIFLMIGSIYEAYTNTGDIFLNNGSLIDRFFGFVGPLSLLDKPLAWFGFGFGGDSVYFKQMFNPDITAVILSVKGDLPSISSLQGKMLMYGGIWGYALYLTLWITAWHQTPKGHVARAILPAIFLGSLFSLGPIFLPYVWLWLAIAVTSAK
jgi:hypothetical protein